MTGQRLSILCLALVMLLSASCILPSGLRGGSGGSVKVRSSPKDGELAAGHWHYLEPSGTSCANGTPVGFGFNPGSDTDRLVVFLNGGGACWDAPSCNLLHTAANLDQDYDARRLGLELAPIVEAGLFDRESEQSPWAGAHFAFIPYCTGDLHTGNQVTRYDSFGGEKSLHHKGAENIREFLDVLAALAPQPRQVWLLGTSAGGYGATWHYSRFRTVFPGAQIHLFSDASPWVPLSEELWSSWRHNWAMEMPAGCPRCEEAPDHLIPVLLKTYPDARFALAAHERDATLSAFIGILPGEFAEDLRWFIEHRFQGENAAVFIAHGTDHETLLHLKAGLSSIEGEDLGQFLRRWAHGGETTQPLPPPAAHGSGAP